MYEQPQQPHLPALTTQETALIRSDYPSIEHLEAGNIGPWLVERQDQLLVRAKNERTGMNLAKLITLSGGAIGAVCYATSPLALIGALVAGVGYVWSVAQDMNDSHQFAPVPFVRGNFIDFLQAMGDQEARAEWFANQNEIVDLMFHLNPLERYEFGMLRGHSHLVAEYLSRVDAGKRFYAYRWILDWFINLKGGFPSPQDLSAHLLAVTKDPRVNYDQVQQLQQYQSHINSLKHTQLPIAPSTPLLEAQVVSVSQEPGTSLEQWLSQGNGNQTDEKNMTITHANPAIAQIAQVISNTFNTHRAPCKFIDGIDGYKFFRLTWRTEPSTSVKKVMELSDNLFAELGTILPDLAKAPLISQVKGGLLAVDVAKPNTDWRIAYFRDYITPSSFGCEVPISLPIGVDMDGRLSKIILSEHNTRSLLVGGTPGGGKSKWAVSAICSLICQYSPDSVKLILSDVQQVEFEAFRNLPHLFAPIANTPEKTVEALRAAKIEMDKRQELFVSVGATNVDEYNAKVDKSKQVPRFVMFVEEIADIVLDSQWTEEFNRLQQQFNQTGRKWGFSLIASTQSPRKEVIPPLIRTLYPSFLAFMVTRPEESRIILGGQDEGAIALLGYGDAIFMTNMGRDRVQTLLVESHEVSAIVSRVIATYGTTQPHPPTNLEKNDLDEARRRLEDSLNLPFDGSEDPVPSSSSLDTGVPVPSSSSDSFPSSGSSSSEKLAEQRQKDFEQIRELRELGTAKADIIKDVWSYHPKKYGEGNMRYLKAIEEHGAEWIQGMRNSGMRVSQIVLMVYGVRSKPRDTYQFYAQKIRDVLGEGTDTQDLDAEADND